MDTGKSKHLCFYVTTHSGAVGAEVLSVIVFASAISALHALEASMSSFFIAAFSP
jgi:hypothetical protein